MSRGEKIDGFHDCAREEFLGVIEGYNKPQREKRENKHHRETVSSVGRRPLISKENSQNILTQHTMRRSPELFRRGWKCRKKRDTTASAIVF